jgi:hypothetical protein
MFVYYIDGKKFTTDNKDGINFYDISSPNEDIPAFEDLYDGYKSWFEKKVIWHRLTGPARIWFDGTKEFYLNGIGYSSIKEWINDHPNPDLYFDKIGLNETDKILWFLQN